MLALRFETGAVESRGERCTGRMGGFESPVCVLCVGDCLAVPFDLEMAGCFLEEGRAGEGVDVEFGLWRHGCFCRGHGWVKMVGC